MEFRDKVKKLTAVSLLMAGICLFLVSWRCAIACGPFSKVALFHNTNHPDLPLKYFAQGNLGVLQPGYARSYLTVAYLYLTGHESSPEKQKQFTKLWLRRLAGFYDKNLYESMQKWLDERKKVATIEAKDKIEVYKYDGYNYYYYLNISSDAFETATDKLAELIKEFGASDERVIAWTKAQDMVFARGGETYNKEKPPVPEPLAEDVDASQRADRDYQIASAYFYGGEFDQAKERFEAIAKDPKSRWNKISSYLVARTLCRQGTTAQTGMNAYMQEAESVIKKLLKDPEMKTYYSALNELYSSVKYRLYPEVRMQELSDVLLSDAKGQNFTEVLGDYTWLLDRKLQKELDEKSKQKKDNKSEGAQLNFVIILFVIASALIAMRRKQIASGHFLPFVLMGTMLISMVACNKESSTAKESKSESTTVATNPKSIAMSEWILNFQSVDKNAFDKAYENWQKKDSVPWLLSAISKAKTDNPNREALLKAAAKVAKTDKAYPSVVYHQIRLLSTMDKDKARELVDSVLAEMGDKLPPSSRNLFRAQKLMLAKSVDQFADLIETSPAIITWDYDGNNLPDEEEEPLLKVEEKDGFSKYPAKVTVEAADLINTKMPLSLTAKVIEKAKLTKQHKLNFVQATFVRSVLLMNDSLANKFASELMVLKPELKNELVAFKNATDKTERQFIAAAIVLNNPAMRPFVNFGIERQTPFQEIDNLRDNWWCAEAPYVSYDEQIDKDAEIVSSLMNEADAKLGKDEFKKLIGLGTAPNALAKMVLNWADKKPNDQRLAKALHQSVRATRYGCEDDETTKYSKMAYKKLHKLFPKTKWAKKTPYWF